MSLQLTDLAKGMLEKQQYRIVGSHSAVKTCGWTKNMIRGRGGCYKLKFYGIMSHQCLQMTTSISCANRCTFCWRDYKSPVSREWKWDADNPKLILEQSIRQHHKLLNGFKGSATANQKLYNESRAVKHVALSLTGEPIMYPGINELINLFHQQKISTFLVTNAQYPEQIRGLRPITQLYISVDAPAKELLREIDKPLFKDYWDRFVKSLENIAEKKHRTCIRLTIIKGVNDVLQEKYAELITKADPDFIEVKAYMFVGASRERLEEKNMPLHEEVVDFSKKLAEHLPDYGIVSEHIPSRVVMLAHKKFFRNGKWHTWIDFKKFFELVPSGDDFGSEDYALPTPNTGISGKGTFDFLDTNKRGKKRSQNKLIIPVVDENTEEVGMWQ